MILDFRILSLRIVIENWWYNTLTRKNNWSLNVLVESNFATPTLFGSVSCFVVGICWSNYNLNSFLIHQASYSKGYKWYLMHTGVLGWNWKIGRSPIKVSEVLQLVDCFAHIYIMYLSNTNKLHDHWLGVLYAWMNGYSTLLHKIAPDKYIAIDVEYGLQLHFKIYLNKLDRKTTTTKTQ